jgi:hypothetical protein
MSSRLAPREKFSDSRRFAIGVALIDGSDIGDTSDDVVDIDGDDTGDAASSQATVCLRGEMDMICVIVMGC